MMMKLSSTMPSAGRVHAKPVNARMLSVLRVSAPAVGSAHARVSCLLSSNL